MNNYLLWDEFIEKTSSSQLIKDVEFLKYIKENNKRKILIVGTNEEGITANNYLNELGFKVSYYFSLDNNTTNIPDDIKIITKEELANYKEYVVILSSTSDLIQSARNTLLGFLIVLELCPVIQYDKGKTLIARNNKEGIEKFFNVYNLLNDEESKSIYLKILYHRMVGGAFFPISNYDQYFHQRISIKDNYHIIDGGAYDGDTAVKFAKSNSSNIRIFSFEPSTILFDRLSKNVVNKNLSEIVEEYNLGLWKERDNLVFDSTLDLGSQKISRVGRNVIEVISIDEFVEKKKLERLDYIKLDIEGAEYEALLGSEVAIKNYNPLLAICLYHEAEHLWDIPLLINKFNQEYTFYLGHHCNLPYETILYAIPNK
ncbi:FkbM family methyltransferase [Bacillus cereus group sp. BfR-BA-01400]|uniref:FkbM family methyltransferase n=1 Tax=Bacillus cereus group sp. BfR-BA-01400 TaxID=2920334 RepID=UPI001F58B272